MVVSLKGYVQLGHHWNQNSSYQRALWGRVGSGRSLAEFCHVHAGAPGRRPHAGFRRVCVECSDSSQSTLWETRDRKHHDILLIKGQDHLVVISIILMTKHRCEPSCSGMFASSGESVIWIRLLSFCYIKSSFTFLCVKCSKSIASSPPLNSKRSTLRPRPQDTKHLDIPKHSGFRLKFAFVGVDLPAFLATFD